MNKENDKKSAHADQLTPKQKTSAAQTIAERIIEMGRANCELFIDESGKTYATFTGQHRERQTAAIESRLFRTALSMWFVNATGRTAKQDHIKEALEALSAYAIHGGSQHPVYIRSAKHKGLYYIDLCNKYWQVAEVGPDGYKILDQSPVKFIRSSSMKALPTPVGGGNIDDLWTFINVPEKDQLLVLAWMLEAFRADTQKPVLELLGTHGSGKSHLTKTIRSLIDPNSSMLRALPKSVDDLFVTSTSSWVLTYENVSHLSPGYQDAMCQISTGAGYAKRKLHTDMDEVSVEIKRPQVINGITPVATRQDLADRTISIDLPAIPDTKKESERAISEKFEALFPKLQGALFQLLADTLAILPDITLNKLPRMADFALFGEAVARAMKSPSGTFIRQFADNQKALALNAMESSPVAMALIELCKRSANNRVYSGNFKQLLIRLEQYKSYQQEGWPKSGKGLSDVLKRQSPALHLLGISLSFLPRTHDGYQILITKQPEETNAPCTSSTQPDQVNEHHALRELISGDATHDDDITEIAI